MPRFVPLEHLGTTVVGVLLGIIYLSVQLYVWCLKEWVDTDRAAWPPLEVSKGCVAEGARSDG